LRRDTDNLKQSISITQRNDKHSYKRGCMSIDSTRPINPLTPVQGSETGTVQPPKNKATDSDNTPSEKTQVNLSDAQANLRQASSGDIDVAKVNSIKQSIRNGDLKINTGKIADALIQQTQSMLDDAE